MEIQRMTWNNNFKELFHPSWHRWMEEIMGSKEVEELFSFLLKEHSRGIRITPKVSNLFKSFQIDLDKLKIVLMGQDPYPQETREGRQLANGIAMDCSNYGKISPTLEKFYEAIEDDCYQGLELNYDMENKSLQYLVDQGVMLTNASLTCAVSKPGSHYEKWKSFWRLVFEKVFSTQAGLIFIFMGKQAQFYERYTTPFIHHILKCEHPVAASYAQRGMDHQHVFSKANVILEQNNGKEFCIEWLKKYEESPPWHTSKNEIKSRIWL